MIRLDIRLNGMVDRADLTRPLTVRTKRSISGTCSFFDAQFRFIPRSVICLSSGMNSQSVCIYVILKPICRYNLCTCMITSAMLSIFRFLIILSVANMICRDLVSRKPIPSMWMRSQKMVTLLYLSRMVLVTLVILIRSICWILHCTVLPFRCSMLIP